MQVVKSVAGIPIRLTEERTEHIERRHPEMIGQGEKILETISSPAYVQEGDSGTLIAIRHYPQTPLTEKYCGVIYRELNEVDGFILTAYFTNRPAEWRTVVWKR